MKSRVTRKDTMKRAAEEEYDVSEMSFEICKRSWSDDSYISNEAKPEGENKVL